MSEEDKKIYHIGKMTEMMVTEQERRVIEILRELDYGEERIVVKSHDIIQIEEKKSIKI